MKPYLFITVDQPAGRFYVATINASELIPISQSDTRTPYNTTGIQRALLPNRVSDIAQYCQKAEAMFPTPIILSGDSKYFKFFQGISDDMDNIEDMIPDNYTNLKSGVLMIDSEAIIREEKFLSIVDGQHRLAGIDKSGRAANFDMLVMFVFDTEAEQDAEIFSVINRNQKQVSKSLVYDLYGLTETSSVEKFAHEIVKAINNMTYSIMNKRIKMLGYKTDNFDDDGEYVPQFVSQGALVDEFIRLISKNSGIDNRIIAEGRRIEIEDGDKIRIFRRFYADDNLVLAQAHAIAFFNAWINKLNCYETFKQTIMFKTIGFVAGVRLLQYAFNEIFDYSVYQSDYSGQNINDIDVGEELVFKYEHEYKTYLNGLFFEGIDIATISSSQSGAKKILDTLLKK